MASPYSIHPQIWERLHAGPLGPHVDAFVALLEEQGYCHDHIAIQLRTAATLTCWLQRQGDTTTALSRDGLARYARSRLRCGPLHHGEAAALRKLLEFLRIRGIVAAEPAGQPAGAVQEVAAAFERYLANERGLSRATVENYLPIVQQFLPACFGRGPIRWAALTPADVTRFVQQQARAGSMGRTRLIVTRLRVFLQYLRFQGVIATDLAACLPSVATWSLAGVPKGLAPGQVQQILAHCDRRTVRGRRASEVVGLTLDDLDWEGGRLALRSKGGQPDQLPLPADVGAAVAAYLQRGRPPCTTRRLFLRLLAPWGPLTDASSISVLVARHWAAAGVQAPHTGAHVFRHTLATDLLRHGASLAEIGALLRHRSVNTTALYAKVDFAALRPLALPWPGGLR